VRGAKPPILPEQRFGRADRSARRAAESPHRLRMKLLIRKQAARLFAEHGGGEVGLRRVAEATGTSEPALRRYYLTCRDLLADVLSEHLSGLNETIGAAFDARPPGPARLEAVVAAWLDHVATEPHAHRTLLFSAHLLPPEQREAVTLKHRILVETAYLALTGAVPALAERPDLTEPLLGTLRALLDDPTTWPEPDAPEGRARRARGRLAVSGRLHLEELRVDSASCDELLVCAFFDYMTVAEHNDAVRHAHRRETVRDHDRHAAAH